MECLLSIDFLDSTRYHASCFVWLRAIREASVKQTRCTTPKVEGCGSYPTRLPKEPVLPLRAALRITLRFRIARSTGAR